MKRHQALQDYSRDHHHLLLQARAIRWCTTGNRHAAPQGEVIAGLLSAWPREIAPHLAEEEALLVPFYATLPGARVEYLARIEREHAWLRAALAQLGKMEPIDETRLARFGQRLHDHVRWEERVWFQQLQQAASAPQLARLAEQVCAYRQEHRPHAIGPRGE